MSERNRADACPGVLEPHQAADGPLVRVRVPGGVLSPDALRGLVTAAEFGDGALELTSRANVQVRAVRELGAFEERVRAAGLLPSRSHERVRNILGSPFSGRLGGTDVTSVNSVLDRELCSRTVFTELPGRFLFAVDDGRGEVARLGADVTVRAESNGWRLLLAGASTTLGAGDPVPLALRAAEEFLAIREGHWRLAEVPDGAARVAAALGGSLLPHAAPREDPAPDSIGVFEQLDGRFALGTLAPFGRLTREQALALTEFGAVRLTPWRGAVLLDLADPAPAVRAAAAAGLVTEADSPWAGVTACAGKPNCAKAIRDVRADASAAIGAPGRPVHWAGCGRHCGKPRGPVVLVEATENGYLIDGVPVGDVTAAVEAARKR
ncbi:hypothetical protein [Sciscionella sediminilitoris]|uniref:hypothetical protein n=1 Tax=Sciscionella sediminilitoris TaxID=1445613 RepID=UPI0007C7A071|nr:hypothetical protein [Sciscionella sp. SE31]